MTSHNDNLKAVIIVVFAYLGFSGADMFSKMLGQVYDVHQILVTTSSIGILITGFWVWRSLGWRGFIPPEKAGAHLLRAVCVAFIPLCVISALKLMPMADYYGIAFCAPFITLVLSYFFLGEKIGLWRWGCVAAGFVGILIIAGPQFDQFGLGIAMALFAATCVAASIIAVRKIGPKAPRPLYVFYPFVAIFLMNIGFIPFVDELRAVPLGDYWQFAALVTLVMLSQYGFAIGHATASEAAVTAPFLYTQIIWGLLFGWLVFGDIPVPTTWIGVAIVIAAGLYSIWREYRTHRAIDSIPVPGQPL